MKLYIKDDEEIPAVKYLADEVSAPEGFTITVDPIDWDKNYYLLDEEYKDYRNEMISQFEPNWDGYSDDQKKVLVRNYIYPSETSDEELDALYTDAERLIYEEDVMNQLGSIRCVIRQSITADSLKYFDLQVADDGIASPKEIKTDTII